MQVRRAFHDKSMADEPRVTGPRHRLPLLGPGRRDRAAGFVRATGRAARSDPLAGTVIVRRRQAAVKRVTPCETMRGSSRPARESPATARRTSRDAASSSPLMRGLTFLVGVALCASVMSSLSGQTGGQPPATSRISSVAEELAPFVDRLIPEQLSRRRIAGAVVVVVKDDRVLLDRQYGMADVATSRPMTADTLMRIGSATKTITALAVMQLVEAGKLDLDREVSGDLRVQLPSAPDRPPVTLRRLLSHRTGFEDRRSAIASLSGPPLPLLPYLRTHMPARLRQDDEVVAYSNYNASLAAALVGRASGQPFEEYVAGRIFAPLGMSSTTAGQPLPAAMQSLVSNGYARADQPPTIVSSAVATIHEVGSTGVSTTSGDMGRLLRALLAPDPRILSRASLDVMMTPQGRVPHGFIGLGLYSPVGLGGNSFVGHDGGTGGFQTTLALLPRERFGLLVSYNSDGVPDVGSAPAELVRTIASRFFPEPAIAGSGDAGVWRGAYQPARREDGQLFTLSALLGQFAVRDLGNGRVVLGRAAVPIGGIALEPQTPGVYRGGGLEASFAQLDSATVMQLGAPVLMYVRVPWWKSARLVMPILLVSLLIAGLMVAMLP